MTDECTKPALKSEQAQARCAKELGPDDYRIGRLKCVGKHMEFWWEGETEGRYSNACKNYRFFRIFDDAMEHHILLYGCVGLIVTWPDGSDWPTRVRKRGHEQMNTAEYKCPNCGSIWVSGEGGRDETCQACMTQGTQTNVEIEVFEDLGRLLREMKP